MLSAVEIDDTHPFQTRVVVVMAKIVDRETVIREAARALQREVVRYESSSGRSSYRKHDGD